MGRDFALSTMAFIYSNVQSVFWEAYKLLSPLVHCYTNKNSYAGAVQKLQLVKIKHLFFDTFQITAQNGSK